MNRVHIGKDSKKKKGKGGVGNRKDNMCGEANRKKIVNSENVQHMNQVNSALGT